MTVPSAASVAAPSPSQRFPAPALEAQGLSMTFPGTRALDDMSLSVRSGQVHALVGHNGCGKSTLIKILSGLHSPDAGSQVHLSGEPLPWGSPHESQRLGLRVVHQNLGLVAGLSITENVAMGAGYQVKGLARVNWRAEHQAVSEQMMRLGYDVDPRQPVDALPAAARSAVAVARALRPQAGRRDPQLLLLDEVTATMPAREIDNLLQLVRHLKEQGTAVLYVSHHLEEVLEIADQVTVLRNGRNVASLPAGELTTKELADLVVGTADWRTDRSVRWSQEASGGEETSAALQVRDLSGPSLLGLSFDAGPGRIVGVAGITGSGRDEVAALIFGSQARSGTVHLDGVAVPDRDPRASMGMGMALVPAERLRNAIIPTQNVRENLILGGLHSLGAFSLLDHRSEVRDVRRWLDKLRVRGATVHGSITTLSGGNQQKVVLARCLNAQPRVLLLDEPTQGVDIGAVSEIHDLVREVARDATVVVCSSDNYELSALCTEVLVLHRGHVVGHLQGADVNEENLNLLQLAPPTPTREPHPPLSQEVS